jgi:hypothetical protein
VVAALKTVFNNENLAAAWQHTLMLAVELNLTPSRSLFDCPYARILI